MQGWHSRAAALGPGPGVLPRLLDPHSARHYLGASEREHQGAGPSAGGAALLTLQCQQTSDPYHGLIQACHTCRS